MFNLFRRKEYVTREEFKKEISSTNKELAKLIIKNFELGQDVFKLKHPSESTPIKAASGPTKRTVKKPAGKK